MMQVLLRVRVGGLIISALLFGMGASVGLLPVWGGAAAMALEPSKLQADADGLMKNVEEMMAHGGMGDAKAIVHHCGEAARHAETLMTQLTESDPRAQDARTSLDEVVRQCRRVSERGVHADPGSLLNPAIKARAAARDSVKALGLNRVNRS
ncbi:hypothetical protein ACO9S2_01695 [Nitrospira sp. NS4]|uniref:hypothetical protein n=1 Tax=Nitrospira sp. NS4 TaxID=3414498 RepID=UPI003C2F6709